MRILYHSHSNTIGGAELSLYETICYMKNNGHDVFVILPFSNNLDFVILIKPFCNEIAYIKPMVVYSQNKLKLGLFKSVFRYLYLSFKCGWHIKPVFFIWRRIKNWEIDIVHTNTVFSMDAAIAAKIAHVPHVLHIRELTGFEKGSTIQLFFQKTNNFKKIMDYLNRKILCNSKFTFQMNQNYFPIGKMEVIYNPIKGINPSEKVKNLNIVRFGCVANLTSTGKNHELAILLFKKLVDNNFNIKLELNFYGTLPAIETEYLISIKKLIEKLNLTKSVCFLGSINKELIYNSIDVLIHPNFAETFGRVIIESMSENVLVIGVNGGGCKELIEHNITGLLFSENLPINEINEINYVINNLNFRNEITRNANRFSKKFEPELILKSLENIYEQILFDTRFNKKK